MKTDTTTPRLYVGTYAKYNAGSLGGEWLELDDYSDAESFLDACNELHADEEEPEFMFQGFEGFPREFYSESVNVKGLEKLFEFLALDDDDREIVTLYTDNMFSGSIEDLDFDDAKEAFQGFFDSKEDWAAEYWESTGLLSSIPNDLRYYIDYESFARDAQKSGDVSFIECSQGVAVFSNY